MRRARLPLAPWRIYRNKHRFVRDTCAGTDCRTAVHPLLPGDSRYDGARQALSYHLSTVSNAHRVGSGGVPKCSHGDVECMTDDRGESQRPSGPRPEGRWCSIELSCDRGQLPLVPHHRGRLTIHPSCMPRLTLADHLSRQTDRHESFDHARRIAARRCSTSASMCSSRATQREQRCGDGEGRDCSPPRTAAVL